MATMAASAIRARSGDIRRALKNGEQVHLTFHDKPWARVIPDDYLTALEIENARLRAHLAELEEAAA